MKTAVIDARMIQDDFMHGISRYVYNLLLGLDRLVSEIKFVVLVVKKSPLYRRCWNQHITLVSTRIPWMSFQEQIMLPAVIRNFKASLFHATSFVVFRGLKCPTLITIHDMNHVALAKNYSYKQAVYYKCICLPMIKASKAVVSVSEFSKKEIAKFCKISLSKIHVTYNGVSSYKPSYAFLEHVKNKFNLKKDFIFAIASTKDHKNTLNLLKAYQCLNIENTLVLLGSVDGVCKQQCRQKNIKVISYLSDEELFAFYVLAKVFVYPSYYEGFGLPPLEALACGTSVVAAKASSLPEVLGQYAYYCNPFSYEDIAAAIARALSSKSHFSSEGVKKHLERFSWETLAKKTLGLYQQCF